MKTIRGPYLEIEISALAGSLNQGRWMTRPTAGSLAQHLKSSGNALDDGVELTIDFHNTTRTKRLPEGEFGAFQLGQTVVIGYSYLEATLQGYKLLPKALATMAFYLTDKWDLSIHEVVFVPKLDTRADEPRFLSSLKHGNQTTLRHLSKPEYDRQPQPVRDALDAAIARGSSSPTGGFAIEATALQHLHAMAVDFLTPTTRHYSYNGNRNQAFPLPCIYGRELRAYRRNFLGIP